MCHCSLATTCMQTTPPRHRLSTSTFPFFIYRSMRHGTDRVKLEVKRSMTNDYLPHCSRGYRRRRPSSFRGMPTMRVETMERGAQSIPDVDSVMVGETLQWNSCVGLLLLSSSSGIARHKPNPRGTCYRRLLVILEQASRVGLG